MSKSSTIIGLICSFLAVAACDSPSDRERVDIGNAQDDWTTGAKDHCLSSEWPPKPSATDEEMWDLYKTYTVCEDIPDRAMVVLDILIQRQDAAAMYSKYATMISGGEIDRNALDLLQRSARLGYKPAVEELERMGSEPPSAIESKG